MAGKHKKNYKISAEKPIGGTAIKQSLGSRIFDIFNICFFRIINSLFSYFGMNSTTANIA